jgi:hypothetical protein
MEAVVVPLLVGIAGFLIQRGLRNTQTARWHLIGAGSIALILAGLLLGRLASWGGWGGVLAFILLLATGVVAVGICIWLVLALPSWRRLASLGFAAATALIGWVSWEVGDYYSPETTVRRNAEAIIRSLEEYHMESSTYPATLDELVPTHLPKLPEAVTMQDTGWLYKSTGTTYTLGYWMWPEKYGVYLCLYTSGSEGRECRSTGYSEEGWEPFQPVPTPTPTPVGN